MSPTSLALNSTPVDVTYLDGSTETISLRQLTCRQLYEFLDALEHDDTVRIVALCVARPLEWIDTLKPKSYSALAKLAIEQNFPAAMEIMQGDPVASIKLAPLLHRLDAAAKLLPSSSLEPSPAPVSSASPEATGSESSTSPAPGSSPSSPSATGSELATTSA